MRSKKQFLLLAMMGAIFLPELALAATSQGGDLPFVTGLEAIKAAITGQFAFTVSIVGLVGAGAGLIFGGDISGVLRTLVLMTLIVSFIVSSASLLERLTGQGAVIPVAAESIVESGE